MASPDRKDNGDRPFRSTVPLPTRLTEETRRYDQLSRFQEGSSVDFSPFDFETVESGISRLGLQDSESQNLCWEVSNSYRNVSSSSRTPNPPSDSVRFEDLKGMILEYAKDRNYSRFLQQIIDEEEDSGDKIEMIFKEVINSVDELMMDHFGLQVFQKLLEKCNDPQIAQIINVVSCDPNSFTKVCTDSLGTQAVQTLQKSLRTRELISMFTRSLSTIAVPLCKRKYGHLVIQNCLQHFPAEDNMFLMSKVARNCCRSHCLANMKRRFIGLIVCNALRLAEHSHGNYIVQYLLELRDPEITAALLRRLEGSFVTLSLDRHGSRVVERFLTVSSGKQTETIIGELIGDFLILVLDPFGNYVIQAALMASKSFYRSILIDCVRENYPVMVYNKHGRKVLEKLQEM